VRLEDAALAEPAAVAWRGISRGQPRPGERIAVVGDGTVGLITAGWPAGAAAWSCSAWPATA
jgi:threonine dehydrogenase-like Zn-dependent dehydrogenase